MLIIIFQLSLLFLILLSFCITIGVPVIFASPNGWNENKRSIIIGLSLWAFFVILIAILNYFVI